MTTVIKHRYEVLSPLGSGGEGRVVKALDRQHDRVVALKIRRVRDEQDREALLNEARVLLAVPPHPALPLVREDFFDGDEYVVAMDWVDGTDLETLLSDRGRPGLAPSSVLAYLAQAAEALGHLHSQEPPVIHGDVKPANLILTKGGRVKLVDFGMSSAPMARGRRAGTPGYRAPELAAEGTAMRTSDVYALAATAFALLTGSPPAGVLPEWDGIDKAQAEQLEAAIRLGMATDPDARPATAGELVERMRAGWGAALPTGVVTLCLSDIEGSTAMWDRDPSTMAEALVRHDELVADCVESHGGRLIKSMGEGDSTVSVFDSAPQALQAAVSVTRALAAERWPGDLNISVRFGLHTGEAERRGADYFGPTVNLAARLRGQADGGQIFLSAVTADLVASHLPPDCELVSLGPHRLRGLGAPENIHALKGPGIQAPLPVTECPYKGLLSFEPEDREFFRGREEIVKELVGRVRPGRLLALVGASGSGKSSVLRAGLIATVEAGEVPDVERAVLVTPGREAALEVSGEAAELVVVDQFEELFTLCEDPGRRTEYVDELLALPGPVVIGVRADFYGQLSTHAQLARAVAENQILLGAMTGAELERAVTEPARLAGLRLEPGLVDLVLRDVGREPGALPLLSHALRATWERRDGRTLTVEGYRESGGVASAVAQTADTVVESLPAERRALMRTLFLRLTELGDATEDTRRRVGIHELVPVGATEGTVQSLLEQLADARLVTLGEGTAEVAHEVLIREWPTLREWLTEDREGIRLHRRLGDSARLWEAGGRASSDVYRGARLAAAAEWAQAHEAELNASERAFLDAGVAEADRERRAQIKVNRRLRRLLAFGACLLVIAVAAAVVALNQRSRADDRTRDATIQRLAAESAALGDDDVVTSALLAAEAFRRDESPRTRSALIGALEAGPEKLRYFGRDLSGSAIPFAKVVDGGRTFVTLHAQAIEFYDARTLQPTARPIEVKGAGEPGDFDITESGRFLVVSDLTGRIEYWDVERRRRLLEIAPRKGRGLNDLSISNDGRRIAITDSKDGEAPALRVLDPSGKVVAGPVALGPFGTPEAKFCAGDATLITGAVTASGAALSIVRRRADTLAPMGPPITTPGTGFAQLHCIPEAGAAAVTAFGGPVRIMDARAGRWVGPPLGTNSLAGAVTPDRRTAVMLDYNGFLHRYDLRSGEALGSPINTGLLFGDLAITPDGRRAFVVSLRMAEIALDGSSSLGPLIPRTRGARRVSVGRSGTAAVVTGAVERPVTRFVDVRTGRRRGAIAALAQHLPDGRSIVSLSPDGEVAVGTPAQPGRRWRRRLVRPGPPEVRVTHPIHHVVSPNGRLLAIIGGLDVLQTVDLATGRKLAGPIGDLEENKPRAMAFTGDGSRLAVSFRPGDRVEIRDSRSGRRTGRPIQVGDASAHGVWFSPDDEKLVLALEDGTLGLADVRTRKFDGVLPKGHTVRVIALSFLRDGKTFITWALDGTTRMWDLDARLQVGRPLPGGPSPIVGNFGLADSTFAPTRDGVLIPTPAGVLRANLDPDTLVDRACARAGVNLTRLAFSQYLPRETYRRTCPEYAEPTRTAAER